MKRRIAFATAAVVAAAAAGIAYAAIPDAGTGTFHACMLKSVGTIRIIDPSTQRCSTTLETPISFGAKGDQGLPGTAGAAGADGASPTVASLPVGDPACPTGGAAITDAAGSTAAVCNGAAGADGQPFSGTFTSPNGQYSISVTDTGVRLSAPGGTNVTLGANTISVQSGGTSTWRTNTAFDLLAGTNVSVNAGTNFDLRASGAASLQAAATFAARGALLSLNGGTSCLPPIRLTDFGTAVDSFTGQTFVSSIGPGSATVCIGG